VGWQGPDRLPIQAVPDELLTRAEVAERTRSSVSTVDRQIAAGLPTVRFSPGTVRIRWSDVLRWCEDRAMSQERAA
jgi:predicted DNA-binding transcriptional regulator AlpA